MELPSGEHTQEKMTDWCQRYRCQGEHVWKEEISKEKAEARYWILRPMVEVQAGDRIVIPKMPTWGSFCIAVATRQDEFDTSSRTNPEDDDFRHVIPVQSELRIVPHLSSADSQIVASSLKGYQRAVNAVWKSSVKDSIESLVRADVPAPSGDVATLFSEVGRAVTEKIVDELMSKLVGLQWNVFEDLARSVLSRT